MLQRVAEAWVPGRNKERTPRSLAKPGRSILEDAHETGGFIVNTEDNHEL
jgi:hypothetical protein